jgi:hypothetical protein
MAALTPQSIAAAGLTPSYSAASSGGDTVAAPSGDERTFLHVKNGGGSAQTVTINPVSPTSAKVPGVGQVAVPAISVSVPAGSEKMIGPIPAAYIDATGNINVGYSGVTSLTIAALRLPAASL